MLSSEKGAKKPLIKYALSTLASPSFRTLPHAEAGVRHSLTSLMKC